MLQASPNLDFSDSDKSNMIEETKTSSVNTTKEHKSQLQRLEEKDPEFYQFLKEHDKELLDFNDEDIDDDPETGVDDIEHIDEGTYEETETTFGDRKPKGCKLQVEVETRKVITSEMVDLWCTGIKKDEKLSAVRSLLRAFRIACHHGDDSSETFGIVSSSVFNKIMVFVLTEMDGVLRKLLNFPKSGGKKETVTDLMTTTPWKRYGSLMKLYLGSALHVLNQMTDEQMAAFTLKRVKDSSVFLAAFPVLLRKYLKVVLHFWGIGGGALQVVSFLFLRELCIRLGSDCLNTCLKGIYKAYVMVCRIKGKHASPSKLQHLRFLGNCVTELYGVDPSSAYQHAFTCIRQLGTILRIAISDKPKAKGKKEEDKGSKKERRGPKKSKEENTKNKKEAYLKVYDWQFINCLELWTNVICANSSDADFRHLAYPLTQVILGVARLVPTARYMPIRIQCARMLNRIGAATETFIPVSLLLLDVLEMKELTSPPTGGVGKAVDLFTRKLVGKPTLKTRAFQEICIFSIVEQLAQHLAQWSHSVAFFELSFVIVVRLQNFCKVTRIDFLRKEVKKLIRQVEANTEFTNAMRASLSCAPGDPKVTNFPKVGKESGTSPLSRFAADLQQKAQERSNSMVQSSVIVGTESSKSSSKQLESEDDDDDSDDGDLEGTTVFSSSWLPDSNSTAGLAKSKHPKEQQQLLQNKEHHVSNDEDVVEDLILSSDDDEPASSISSSDEEKDVSNKATSGGKNKNTKLSSAPQRQPQPQAGGKNKKGWETKKRKSSSAPKKKWGLPAKKSKQSKGVNT